MLLSMGDLISSVVGVTQGQGRGKPDFLSRTDWEALGLGVMGLSGMTAAPRAACASFREADGVGLCGSRPGWEYSGADLGDGKLPCS